MNQKTTPPLTPDAGAAPVAWQDDPEFPKNVWVTPQGICHSTEDAAASFYGNTRVPSRLYEQARPRPATPLDVEAVRRENEALRAALVKLTSAATKVSACGATTGAQWTYLSAGLVAARAALATRHEPGHE